MTIFRQEPVIYKDDAKPVQPEKDVQRPGFGCIVSLFLFAIAYFITRSFTNIQAGNATTLDYFACWGSLIGFLVILFWRYILNLPVQQAERRKKKEWVDACIVSDVEIVDREYDAGGVVGDDYGFQYRRSSASLDLRMNIDQLAAYPDHAIVKVKVSEYIYRKLENRDSVKIYYQPENPLTFLLEEEIA